MANSIIAWNVSLWSKFKSCGMTVFLTMESRFISIAVKGEDRGMWEHLQVKLISYLLQQIQAPVSIYWDQKHALLVPSCTLSPAHLTRWFNAEFSIIFSLTSSTLFWGKQTMFERERQRQRQVERDRERWRETERERDGDRE